MSYSVFLYSTTADVPRIRRTDPDRAPLQGIFGSEGKPPALGICGITPPLAFAEAQEPRMSVACCIAYAFIMSVAVGSGRLVLPANELAAAESTPGSLRAEGPAAVGFGNLLAMAEHNALLAADC